MTNTATKTYRVYVIERALAYYEVEAVDARAAAENWQDGEFIDRDDEALDTEGPSSVREQQPDGTWRKVPGSEWEAVPSVAAPGNKPFSVLLLYPDHINEGGTETYYAWVEAADAIEAVATAQRQAVAANDCVESEQQDFAPLLVTEGHQADQSFSNN
jgi:hypothetical protein